MVSKPDNSPGEPNQDDSEAEKSTLQLSKESRDNFGFAAKIAFTISVCCILGAIYTGYVAIRDIRDLNEIYGGWSWIHYLTLVRSLFLPVLLVFSLISWRAASSMREIGTAGTIDSETWDKHSSNATWVWIGLTLFVLVSMLEMVARYSMFFFEGI